MELKTRLKHYKRKMRHAKFLEAIITDLHSEIVKDVLNGIRPENKAKLLKKYNKRLKLILY